VKSRYRAGLVATLVALTVARRQTGWALDGEVYLECEGWTVAVMWCDESKSYGATWTCGSVDPVAIGRLVDLRAT
jgi:hypothetical protein